MTKRELGESYFAAGYNCAQSVVLAFKDELNMDEETLKKISSAFAASSGTAEKSAAETNPADCVSRHADNKNARVFFFIYILLLKRMIFIIRL